MSRRGGYIGEGVVNSIGEGVNAANTAVGTYVIAPVTGAADVVVEKTKEGAQNANTGFWSFLGYGNPAAPAAVVVPPPQQQPVASQGGSRRRKRSGRKSKNMFSGLMKMVGFKTKKRGRRGGIGGPSNGYLQIVGANFPSAANAQGNNIYDLAPFDPSKPFTGGMKGGCSPSRSSPLSPAPFPGDGMMGGCSPSPLSPAPFPGDGMMGGKSKRHRKRHGGTKKCAWK
jgi:hypothetical protein